MRDVYLPLAEELGCVLLAPCFPAALTADEELHNYVFLRYGDVRFDELLMSMVDEVLAQYEVSPGKFWLAGFSGGAQFAHRFAYLHASRLAGLSLAAPGTITSLSPHQQWFTGVKGVQSILGIDIDWVGLRALKVHVAVGANDTRPEVTIPPSSPLFCPGINDSGGTRVARAIRLHELLIDAGIESHLDIVPNADHVPSDLVPAVSEYFRQAFAKAN
ncbi:hypothetical protein PGB34_01860 [Xenophilus arseniciresistens]|uniref:Alpha/beta hydrolase n=1 Tax=Xenophilus arseniciresistens TaxID=1283306 RepID=A0AAE3SXM4_9BURK|nr:hypothetical protein [Xenophilus arseniciresistens]MDA7415099.1 hypothetical protein [Xenophilus arseniciresistens]